MNFTLRLLLIASAALAQTPPGAIDAPILGFVFDRDAAAVRPLAGIPGAATLAAPIADTIGWRAAQADPRGYILGIDASGLPALLTARGLSPLEGAAPGVTRVYLSNSGTAAAAYRPAAGLLDIFTGVPDSARLARSLPLDAAPAALALADDGASVAILARARRGFDTVSWIAANGVPTTIYRARRIESVALLDGAALVAEPASVKLVSPAFGAQTLADGLDQVVAAAPSADGARIAIAMQSGRVAILDRASGARATVSCACAPAILAPLRGNAVFRLNETGGGPLWILDADAPEPRIVFVADPVGGAQ